MDARATIEEHVTVQPGTSIAILAGSAQLGSPPFGVTSAGRPAGRPASWPGDPKCNNDGDDDNDNDNDMMMIMIMK